MSVGTTVEDLVSVVTTVGFPIVVAAFLLWERYTINRKLSKQLEKLLHMLGNKVSEGST